jgi:hypothetical protein
MFDRTLMRSTEECPKLPPIASPWWINFEDPNRYLERQLGEKFYTQSPQFRVRSTMDHPVDGLY